MVDGSHGSYDALMYDTTLTASKIFHPYFQQEELNQIVSILHKNDYQIAFHVWGDKAADMALDALEAASKETPGKDNRHTLEHIAYPSKQNLERIKQLGVIASMQPAFIYFLGTGMKRYTNDEVAQRIMPLPTMLDTDIAMCFGTDNPEQPDNAPKWGFVGAIARETWPFNEQLNPKECITIQQALRCYTMGSAYATFQEKIRGSIEEGKIADMVVWSHDLYTMPKEELKDMKAEITIVGGKVLYKADGCTLSLVKGAEMVPSSKK
jgi:predicted amidohydrolase YtcJ